MLNISDAEKALYRDDGVPKTVTITVPDLSLTIDNSDLIKESVQLTERIETDKNLSFKGCNASVFSFEVAHFSTDIRGRYIEATIQATDQGEVLPLFSGYVDSQTNTNYEDYVSKITAYDALQPILTQDVTAWYNALSFPITIKNLRDSFFAHVGLTQETTYLVNDGQTVNKSIDDPTITGATILKSICQISGRYGIYGRDKIFHYRRLGRVDEGTFPGSPTFPSFNLFPAESNANEQILKDLYSAVSYQPYNTKKVSKVVIIGQDGAIKGQSGNDTADTFYIADNKLAWGFNNANQAAANIVSEIGEVAFTPARLECKGLPYIECGDIFLANTRINAVSSYVLERTLVGIQALRDTYVGDIDEKRKPYALSVQTEISANESAASAAQSTASGAASAASNAQDSADNAGRAAGRAQDKADSAYTLAASKITADEVDSKIINAGFLKASDISAIRIDASQIVSGVISASRIDVNTLVGDSFRGKSIYAGNFYASGTIQAVGGGAVIGSMANFDNIVIGGQRCYWTSTNVRLAGGAARTITYLTHG